MSEADIKLKIVRLVDSQHGTVLQELYELILDRIYQAEKATQISQLEAGYLEMSQDDDREEDAFDWIEGTLNSDDL